MTPPQNTDGRNPRSTIAAVVPLRAHRSHNAPATNAARREPRIHCIDCALRERCLPGGLTGDDVWHFDELFDDQRHLGKGDALFHAGSPFDCLFVIRVGSVKTNILAEDGREQVAGYQMPGDIVGLDGIATGTHTCSAYALEGCELCAVPFERFEHLGQSVPQLRQTLRHLLASEVNRNHCHMLLLGSMRAEERVISFLLDLAERYRRRGYSPSEFMLRMTREEIGSYLGLKLETVSRVFSRLQAEGLIEAHGRDIRMLDATRLHDLLGKDSLHPDH